MIQVYLFFEIHSEPVQQDESRIPSELKTEYRVYESLPVLPAVGQSFYLPVDPGPTTSGRFVWEALFRVTAVKWLLNSDKQWIPRIHLKTVLPDSERRTVADLEKALAARGGERLL